MSVNRKKKNQLTADLEKEQNLLQTCDRTEGYATW